MEKEKKPDNPWYYYLNSRLIKKRKPCVSGDYVHLKSFQGCFKVYSVDTRGFTIIKDHKEVNMCWEQFKCLKGHGESEEAYLRKELKSLINTISVTMTNHSKISSILSEELKNLRKNYN